MEGIKMKHIKMLFLTSIVMLFTACGGGSSSDPTTPLNPQAEAISKIMVYADDDTQPAPTILTYTVAGVEGVTLENIDDVNSAVASLTASDVDTTEKIQKVVDDLGVNILPTATAGPDKNVEVNQAVTITGSGSDVDGMIVSYEWTKDNTVLAITASFEYIPTNVAIDTLTLTVIDDDGGIAFDTVTINVINAPIIHNGITYKTVVSPYTGKIWLDRNLGATQACTALDDTACYGDYYQWGRGTDGHEKPDSAIAAGALATDINDAGTDFITHDGISPYDWTTVDVDGTLRNAAWSKTDGTSICPIDYRVPTVTEIEAEITEVKNNIDAFNNFLKLPSSGNRYNHDGSLANLGTGGHLWSSSVNSYDSYNLHFYSVLAYTGSNSRSNGYSVRCVKD